MSPPPPCLPIKRETHLGSAIVRLSTIFLLSLLLFFVKNVPCSRGNFTTFHTNGPPHFLPQIDAPGLVELSFNQSSIIIADCSNATVNGVTCVVEDLRLKDAVTCVVEDLRLKDAVTCVVEDLRLKDAVTCLC